MELEARPSAPQDWDFWTEGLHWSFTSALYKRATQIGLAAALIFLGFDQRQISLGILCGLGVALFSVWTIEITVKLLFNGGAGAGVKLALGAIVKMPFLLAGLLGIAWSCMNGIMNPFAVVGGVLVSHGVMLVHVVASALAAQERNRQKRR
jgi:hypothetical protein